jgi:hypothetical protein
MTSNSVAVTHPPANHSIYLEHWLFSNVIKYRNLSTQCNPLLGWQYPLSRIYALVYVIIVHHMLTLVSICRNEGRVESWNWRWVGGSVEAPWNNCDSWPLICWRSQRYPALTCSNVCLWHSPPIKYGQIRRGGFLDWAMSCSNNRFHIQYYQLACILLPISAPASSLARQQQLYWGDVDCRVYACANSDLELATCIRTVAWASQQTATLPALIWLGQFDVTLPSPLLNVLVINGSDN